jgi:hypothetical protein
MPDLHPPQVRAEWRVLPVSGTPQETAIAFPSIFINNSKIDEMDRTGLRGPISDGVDTFPSVFINTPRIIE